MMALLALLFSVAPLVVVGCRGHDAASRATLVRSLDDIRARPRVDTPTLDSVLRARMTVPAEYAKADVDAGALGDAQRALIDLDDGSAFATIVSASDDSRLWRLGCLHGLAAGRPEIVVKSCAQLLDAGHDQALAPAFAAALALARDEAPGVDDRVLEDGQRWIDACAREGARECAPLATVVHQMQMNASSRRGDVDEVRAIAERSGLVTRYAIEGPLAGDVDLALSQAANGERPRLRATRSFAVVRDVIDGKVAPALRADAGVYRLEAGFSGEGDVEFSVRSDDAFVMSIDDQVLLERPIGRVGFPHVARVGAHLSRGEHRIAVTMLASSSSDRFELRALSRRGAPIVKALTSTTQVAGAVPRALTDVLPRPAGQSGFRSLDESMASAALRLAGFFVDESDALAVEKRLVSDLSLTPTALIAASHALAFDRTLPSTLSRTLITPLLDLVDTRAPAHPDVAIFRAEMQMDEHPEMALDELNRALARRPSSHALHRARVHVSLLLNALHDALASAEVLSSIPLTPSDLELSIQVLLARGDLEASARLERMRGDIDDDIFGTARARALLAVGAREAAVAELQRIVDAGGGSIAAELLWDLLELTTPDVALAQMRSHLDAFPLDRSTWKRRIALERAVSGDDAARQALRVAEARFGVQREFIDMAVELGARAPWADELERIDAVVGSPSPGVVGDSGHPLLLLDDAHTRTFFEDGTSHLVRAFVARIESKDGIDALGEVRVAPGEELLRLRVHKPDGQVLEPDFHDGVADVSLAGLAVGDVVELVAVSFIEWPILDAVGFETRVLAQALPARRRSYTVELPSSVYSSPRLKLFHHHGAPAPVVTDSAHGRRSTFVVENVPGIPSEDGAVSDEEALPTVGYAIGLDDEAWAALLRQRSVPEATTSAWLEEAARLVASRGPSAKRLASIERFVATRIEPGDGNDPLQTLASGRGARVPLVAALCRAVGLEVHPVAIEVPALSPEGQPNGNAWSARGVRVRTDNGDHYLVGDERLGELDALPVVLEGARALDLRTERPRAGLLAFIDDDEPLVVDVPLSAIDARPVRVQVSLEPDPVSRALSGVVVYQVPRSSAGPLRRVLARASDEERRAIFEGILSASMTPLVVTAVSLPDIENNGSDLTVGVLITIPIDAGESVRRFERLFPDGAGVAVGLFPSLARPLRHVERVRPMRFLAAEEQLVVDLRLPSGATFTEVPEARRAVAGPVSLSTEIEVTDGVLHLERTLKIARERVEPREWPALRAQLARLVSLADAQIGFVWSSATSSPM
jgi:hypothetical protein